MATLLIIVVFVVSGALSGLLEAALEPAQASMVTWIDGAFGVGLIVAWYVLDCRQRLRPASLREGLWIGALSAIAVPIYLLRTRELARALTASLAALGIYAACAGASYAAQVAYYAHSAQV